MNLLRIRNAIFATIIFFAVTHILILSVESLRSLSAKPLNVFNILNIGEYLPKVLTSQGVGDMASIGFVAIVFFSFLFLKKKS